MVEIEDIEKQLSQREMDLASVEREAQDISREEIPQRRFGRRVTRQQQLSVQRRRGQAREVLRQAREERVRIGIVRGELAEARRQRLRQEAISESLRRGRIVGEQNLTSTERRRIQQTILLQRRGFRLQQERISELQAQGLSRQELETRLRQEAGGQVTGGQTLITGEQVEVTPSGRIVRVTGIDPQAQRQIDQGISFPSRRTGLQLAETSSPTALQSETQRIRSETLDLSLPTSQRVAAQFALPIVSTLALGESLIRSPRQTVSQIGTGLRQLPSEITSGRLLRRTTTFAREQPLPFAARVAGETVTFLGTGAALRPVTATAGTAVDLGRAVGRGASFRRLQTVPVPQFRTTEQVLRNVPRGVGDIAAIPQGLQRTAGTLRPSIRGGFGFTQREQAIFRGQTGTVVTAFQSGFTGFGRPLQREFFGTPPIQDTGFFRVSRLGIEAPRSPTFRELLTGRFALRRNRPEIIAFPNQALGRAGGFQRVATPTSELEVSLPRGTIPVRTGVAGVTLIQGRAVPIITARIGRTTPDISRAFRRLQSGQSLSRLEARSLSRASGFQISRQTSSLPVLPLPRLTLTGITSATSRLTRSSSRLTTRTTVIRRPARSPSRFTSTRSAPSRAISRITAPSSIASPSIPTLRITQTRPTSRRRVPSGSVSGRFRRRPRISRSVEDLAIVPDLTSRALGFAVNVRRSDLPAIARRGATPFELRRVPIVR